MKSDGDNSDLTKVIELMNEGIGNGAVIPLERKIYGEENLDEAFK